MKVRPKAAKMVDFEHRSAAYVRVREHRSAEERHLQPLLDEFSDDQEPREQ
ncbi:hypothetical protein C7476_103333 [Phyllobacterium bourgognense]|uniref:Uncharacterized protein n=1 Tax=Phyllobacterium bourgognense TaxID=314236 RepID=A0A368Z120_9HYPH|nr:hypothetical protein C7476_103333 [Phyllobacterium bourgognense]